ncbi:MAG: alanine--tRNA ligase, partial [Muribaculaceae bacterium]|nr:alanine--tRNA ligase [Muribaculaceae bacterium]
ENMLDRMSDTAKEIAAMLNNAPDVVQALRKAIEENADLRKKAEEAVKERAVNTAKELLSKATIKDGIKIVELYGVMIPDVVKTIAFTVRSLSPEGTAFIAATKDVQNKPLLTVMLTDDVVAAGHNAAKIAREAAKAIKGGGGGQPGFAQAGGKDAEGLPKAAEALRTAL